MITPGSWLGLLGGGQLGRMFTMAAQSMGYRVCVLDPSDHSPAGSVADRHIRADYDDVRALEALASLCRGVTTEFENVPAQSLAFLASRCRVSPDAAAVSIAQDRIAEKAFVRRAGIETAPYAEIRSVADLDAAPESLLPGILKVARLGYDGKGQARVATREEARAAFAGMGSVPCVLEQRMALECEISVVVARLGPGGEARGAVTTFPVAENQHASGILDQSIVPARVSESIAAQARDAALAIAEALDYVGVLCVEFFIVAGDRLLVNEIAPRPHNSGHYTIDACVTSQFEQQARILAELPLGSTALLAPAVMINLLGEVWQGRDPDWVTLLSHPQAKLHLYGKTDARQGRKMGHVTCLGETIGQALETARVIRQQLGIDAGT
jgi:5-(carboxyamino)imidazole ribonucleotide synthase